MAWHEGVYACGHPGRVQIYGPVKDRDWKAKREFAKLCPECWKKKADEENQKAVEAAKELGLPEFQEKAPFDHSLMTRFRKRLDASERNAVEGKFGEGKRKYGLGLIRARLQETSETVVALQFLILNLERKLRVLFLKFLHNTILYFDNRNLACI